MNRLRCPRCHRDDCLWEGVTIDGWRSIDAEGKPARIGFPDREAYWDAAIPDGIVGCAECHWEGDVRQLEVIGLDGQPIPDPRGTVPLDL